MAHTHIVKAMAWTKYYSFNYLFITKHTHISTNSVFTHSENTKSHLEMCLFRGFVRNQIALAMRSLFIKSILIESMYFLFHQNREIFAYFSVETFLVSDEKGNYSQNINIRIVSEKY